MHGGLQGGERVSVAVSRLRIWPTNPPSARVLPRPSRRRFSSTLTPSRFLLQLLYPHGRCRFRPGFIRVPFFVRFPGERLQIRPLRRRRRLISGLPLFRVLQRGVLPVFRGLFNHDSLHTNAAKNRASVVPQSQSYRSNELPALY